MVKLELDKSLAKRRVIKSGYFGGLFQKAEIKYYFSLKSAGRKQAAQWDLVNLLKQGNVDIVFVVEDSGDKGVFFKNFVSGLFVGVVEEIPFPKILERLFINGVIITRRPEYGLGVENGFWVNHDILEMLESLKKKLQKKEQKKKREQGVANWSNAFRVMIPEIGTVMRLQEPWTFDLHYEYRNRSLIEATVGEKTSYGRRDSKVGIVLGKVTFAAGTQLTVDRIYIRKGADKFSSVTFYSAGNAQFEFQNAKTETKMKAKTKATQAFENKGKVRFWVKLADVNTMKVCVDEATVK